MDQQLQRTCQELPDVLTAKECAAYLGLSINTVYELVRQNKIPGVVRYGRSIRILKHVLLDEQHLKKAA